ncbi:MAG: hypothetical protein ACK4NQ_07510 [Fimbriimonadaceae bacterium]
MISFVLAASLSSALVSAPVAERASDYFPLQKGTSWSYTDTAERLTLQVEDRAEGEFEVKKAEFEETKEEDKRPGVMMPAIGTYDTRSGFMGRTFYLVSDKDIRVGALSRHEPILEPYPIMVLPLGDTEKFGYDGLVPMSGTTERLVLDGTAKRLASVKVLGNEYPGIEITMDMKIGQGDLLLRVTQVAVYAKGIGLVSMQETVRTERDVTRRTRTLTAFKAAPT